MPERNKYSTYEKMIGALLALCFFFISLEIFFERKSLHGHFYFNKIARYYAPSGTSKVNTKNNFKRTNLTVRT